MGLTLELKSADVNKTDNSLEKINKLSSRVVMSILRITALCMHVIDYIVDFLKS